MFILNFENPNIGEMYGIMLVIRVEILPIRHIDICKNTAQNNQQKLKCLRVYKRFLINHKLLNQGVYRFDMSKIEYYLNASNKFFIKIDEHRNQNKGINIK